MQIDNGDEHITTETFLSLDNSDQLKVLIPKCGPRVKFRKRLKEYKESLNNELTEEMMDTNTNTMSDQEDSTEMVNSCIARQETQSIPRVEQWNATGPVCGNDMSNETFFPGAPVTQEQGILAINLFILRHQLTAHTEADLMASLNVLIPNFTDASKHVFNKKSVNIRENNEAGNFFLFTPLKDLLKDTLESHGTTLLPKTVNHANVINDVMDGRLYQNLIKKKGLAADDITLLWNCDGVPVNKTSIWPLQFTINELPYQIRKQNVLVAGFWCGSGDPEMKTFLKPFIDECCELAKNPLKWIDRNGTVHYSRVFVLVCSSDAVARPLLRNCKQYNGEFGCDWCLYQGTMIKKQNGYIRSYPYDEEKQRTRFKEMFRDNAMCAEKSKQAVNGVKGLNVLFWLPVFDIVDGFVPEYLHAVLLGVSKQLVYLWFEPENSSQSWYLGNKVDEIDTRLLSLKPYLKITRSPLSLKYRASWKAADWQTFLLFYAINVLQPFLSPLFLEHFLLLSCSAHMLLQASITQDDLGIAHDYLVCFVKNMEVLYGEENVTFNCHQLIHLCDSVLNWGPLWAISAFSFEKNNKNLQALLRSVDCNPKNFTERFRIWQHIPRHLSSKVFGDSDFSRLSNPVSSVTYSSVSYTPLGNVCHLDLDDPIILALRDLSKCNVLPKQSKAYESFTNGQTVYHCANSKESDKTKCIIKLKNGCYGEIHFFLANCMCTSNCLCTNSPVIVVKTFEARPVVLFKELYTTKSAKTIFVEGKRTEQVKALFKHDIKCECVYVNGFIVPIPNTHERF